MMKMCVLAIIRGLPENLFAASSSNQHLFLLMVVILTMTGRTRTTATITINNHAYLSLQVRSRAARVLLSLALQRLHKRDKLGSWGKRHCEILWRPKMTGERRDGSKVVRGMKWPKTEELIWSSTAITVTIKVIDGCGFYDVPLIVVYRVWQFNQRSGCQTKLVSD